MNVILLAAALATPCPQNVGAGTSVMIDLYNNLIAIDTAAYEKYRAAGSMSLANQSYLNTVRYRQQLLGEQMRLGYKQLEAGCQVEAKATFESVWGWNGPDYAEFSGQARQALNTMTR